MRCNGLMVACATLAGVILNPGILFPQGERATVTGAVTDPSGQMLVGADVAIRNTGTNIFTRTKTKPGGNLLPARAAARRIRASRRIQRLSSLGHLPTSLWRWG